MTSNFYEVRPVPAPYGLVNLAFFTPEAFGPAIVDQHILGGWNLNAIFDWRDGGYITYDPGTTYQVNNNVKAVNYYNLHLRLAKSFDIGKSKLTLFIDVDNVLNTKRLNMNSFVDNYDYDYYMTSLHLPGNQYYTNIPGNDTVRRFPKRRRRFPTD